MNQHPYLRAYMAGIAAPTMVMLVGLAVFCIARFVYNVPAPIERLIIFPMAVVPNVFGLWNMLYLKLRPHWHAPLGLHGALLPFLLAPAGFAVATTLGFLKATSRGLLYFDCLLVPYSVLIFLPLFGIGGYYLLWKYVVGFFNRVMALD